MLIRRRFLFCLVWLAACTAQEEELTVVLGGDVMLDRGVRAVIEREGAGFLFADVQPVFQEADFTVLNLECPVTAVAQPLRKKFVFRAEPAWLEALREAGITHLNMANNHANDQGREGIVSTADNIRSYGLVPVGVGFDQPQACAPVLLQKGALSVAVFSSVLVPLESWMYLPGRPDVCLATAGDLEKSIKAYKKENPGTFVVVTLHWGVEYQEIPRPSQRMQAAMLVAAGADAVIGHHPHVVQSFERIDGKPVFFSLGNLVFDSRHPRAGEGMLVRLSFRENKQPEVHIVPYHIKSGKPFLMNKEKGGEFAQRLQKYSDSLPPVKRY